MIPTFATSKLESLGEFFQFNILFNDICASLEAMPKVKGILVVVDYSDNGNLSYSSGTLSGKWKEDEE